MSAAPVVTGYSREKPMLATLALRMPSECLKRGLIAHHVKLIRQPSSSGSLLLLAQVLSVCLE